MQNFIKEAINYLDPYQLREIAHTCASARNASFEHMRKSAYVRIPDPIGLKLASDIKISPIDSMLARSSMTSLAGAIDRTNSHTCHPVIVHWFDNLWQKNIVGYDSQRILLIKSVCHYDDVEFARVIFSYIISIAHYVFTFCYCAHWHPWYCAMCASIPKSPEMTRIMSTYVFNQTQSMRVFMFLVSRDMTDLIMTNRPAIDVCKDIFREAVICGNEQIVHAMLNILARNDPLTICIHLKIPSSSVIQFCENNGVIIDMREDNIIIDKDEMMQAMSRDAIMRMDLNCILTLMAMDVREPEIVHNVVSKFAQNDCDMVDVDIIYSCCCADRMDIVDALFTTDVAYLKNDEYNKFNPIALARVRNLAIEHIDDNPLFVEHAVSFILKNTRTEDQVHAFLPPSVMKLFTPILHNTRITSEMHNVWRELNFEPICWNDIIHIIICARDINSVICLTKSLPDITSHELDMCMLCIMRFYPRCKPVCFTESARYLVNRLDTHSTTRSRDMFMLGLLLNNREIMLESQYRLCKKTYSMTSIYYYYHINRYMHENQSISEFFEKSERYGCYMMLIGHVDHVCQTILLSELPNIELALAAGYRGVIVQYNKVNSIELIATAMLRARKRICAQHGRV